MAASTFTAFPDFIAVQWGNRKVTCGLMTGPTSYTQLSPASPPTGGQAIQATQFGMNYIDAVFCTADQATSTAAYTADFVPTTNTPNDITAGILVWRTANGTIDEVSGATNLSTRAVRILVIGR